MSLLSNMKWNSPSGLTRRILIAFIVLSLTLSFLLPSPAFAFSLDSYYTYTYTFIFSKTSVDTGETFSVQVNGTATCVEELPSPFTGAITEASIVARVVARQGSTEVELNPRFTVQFSSIPDNKGESASATETVSLVFPTGSAAGDYTVVGQILEANIKILGIIPYDAKAFLPRLEETMGTVSCGVGGLGFLGGGGGGGGQSQPNPVTDLKSLQDVNGELKESAEAKSVDGLAKITVPQGTKLSANGEIASNIVMNEVTQDKKPPAPDDGAIIGKAYDFGPDGLTFDHPIQLLFSFDPASLPGGVTKANLVIAWWDGKNWVALNGCKIDETANTVSGSITHFTIFTLITAPAPAPTPVATTTTTTPASVQVPAPTKTTPPTTTIPASPTPTIQPSPAKFTLSNLSINPSEINPGEKMTVNVLISNDGDLSDDYEIAMKLNGITVETRKITLPGKSIQPVEFTTSVNKAGVYTLEIGDITGTFTVHESAPLKKPVNWWLWGGLSATLILAIIIAVVVINHKRSVTRT